MTRFPTESRNVIGLEGDGYEPYKVPSSCCIPDCTHYSDHAHHLFSRGQMGGAYNWVRLDTGQETGNLVPLCFRHHQMVTDNAAWIQFEDNVYKWNDLMETARSLTWQPPRLISTDVGTVTVTVYHDDDPPPEARSVCPTCNRRLPKSKIDTPPEEKKQRATWAVSVPVEERENGAVVLDELLEAARDEMDKVGLSYSEGSRVKYYVLTAALGLFVQHASEVLDNA